MNSALALDLFTPGALTESQVSTVEQAFRSDPTGLARLAHQVAEAGRPPVAPVTSAARRITQPMPLLEGPDVRAPLDALLVAPHPEIALQWLHDAGLLKLLLPELEATVDFTQEADRKHKDVWEHTKLVVLQAPLRANVRWAALLHDIGKVPTRTFLPNGKVHFHRHAEVGARMFDSIGRRLGFERVERRCIRFLILHHLRANQYQPTWTDSAVRRFDRESGDYLDDLADLSRADITSKREERRREAWRNLDQLRQRILALREEDARLPLLPSGIGDALMAHYKRSPGRWIAEVKESLEKAIQSGELEPRREAEYYVAWIDANDRLPA